MPQNVLRSLPVDGAARKGHPIFTGVIEYFPLALAEIARVSKDGSDQHNPGRPLHWDRSKSTDHLDCALRHLIEYDRLDDRGQLHLARAAWRLLAALQTHLEETQGFKPSTSWTPPKFLPPK